MVTVEKDLRSGVPVWQEYTTPRIPRQAMESDIAADIVIIGAGVSGAMLAEALSWHGLSIAVLDRRAPMTGSTAASTALLQFEIDVPLTHLKEKVGKEKAIAAWRRSKLGLESLACKIRSLDIKCDYERRNSLYLSGNILNPEQMKRENEARNAIGLSGKMMSRKDLRDEYGIRGQAALLSWDNIACNPVQMASGFLNEALEKGAVLYSPVCVETIEEERTHIRVVTDTGFTIKAKHVVFASGYEIPSFIKTRKHKIHSTWALATAPVSGMPEKYPFAWQAAEPYFYARTTADGRMIFGGEDEEFSDEEKRDARTPVKQRILERKLRQAFPDRTFSVEHVWTGSFGSSTTGLPSMGAIPGKKNCYAVMAYGGNGITFSRIAAEIISAKILGHDDPDAEYFEFSK